VQTATTPHAFTTNAIPDSPPGHDIDVTCAGCGASIPAPANLIAGICSYCSAPFVVTKRHDAGALPDGVIPAAVDLGRAEDALRKWVATRRFAPKSFKSDTGRPRIALSYHPLWIFDTSTTTAYVGERGDDYTVTNWREVPGPDGTMQSEMVTETETRWSHASGTVARQFAGVAASASAASANHHEDLNWDLAGVEGYADAYLVGSTAYAASSPLSAGWAAATVAISPAIDEAIKDDIGGDHQRIDQVDTAYSATSYTYLLAPSWSGDYLFRGKNYSIEVNAETAALTGTRPYSAWKIALAVLVACVIVAGVILLFVLAKGSHSGSNALAAARAVRPLGLALTKIGV
jgi:hypothetical protein